MKWASTVIAVGFVLALAATAGATQIWDEPWYRASTGLTLGASDATKGYVIAQEFQLNMLYQPGIDNAAIAAINNYLGMGTWPVGSLNYYDCESYFLKVDAGGNLPIGLWSDGDQAYAADTGADWVQWTLSGWWSGKYHTILAGDIAEEDVFLRVIPFASYRTFPAELTVNNVEVFGGYPIACEVVGYTFSGDVEDIAEGSVSGVKLVPEPVTMAGLVIGIGCLARYLRKRQAA